MSAAGATRPRDELHSYYGRPVLKAPVWTHEIPLYLFAGGLAGASSGLAYLAGRNGDEELARRAWLNAAAAIGVSPVLLIADLGRPGRFLNMLRLFKVTSPMSVGTWILSAYSPGIGLAAAAEVLPARWRLTGLLRRLARPASLSSAALAPALAGYTAVLLSQTAVPAWNTAHPYLPFVFTGSAAASSGGLAMALVPPAEAGPARTFAAVGAAAELVASRVLEHRIGMVAEAYTTGRAHTLRRWSEYLTAGGLAGILLARRSRVAAVGAGLALAAGSALQRFGVFEAGVASTRDPRYVVTPQRERLATAPGAPER